MAGPPDVMTAGLIAGRYRIERVLGHGATATVHFARDTEKGTAVAIKILRPELAKSRATERFLKEIRRTSQLQHPHILQVLDSGEHEGRPFFVLPYMEGGTLRTRLGRNNQLPFDETLAILRTVASALDYAHDKGLVHRDIKPENILFTNGQACVGDFGIARVLETVYGTDGSTSSDTIRGTYAYMSPEQAAGSQDIDGRSDIYSLACVAYEMITGMQAFIGPTPEAIVAQRFAFTPREVRAYRPSAPAPLDAALAKAFAMTPADRYRSANEFIDALELAVSHTAPAGVGPGTITSEWSAAHGQGRTLLVSVAGIAALSALWLIIAPPPQPVDNATVDTTRIVVLPLNRDSSNPPPWRDDDLLHQALGRWRDIKLVDQFQVADAMRRRGPVLSIDDAASVAKTLGAGRYIRGSLSALGPGWRVSASLYDVGEPDALYNATARLPADARGALAAYASLADSLLLRGTITDSVPVGIVGTRSLPAVQAFGRAQLALDDWDLERADSLFQSAIVFDPEHARANLWLAQVRAWQQSDRNTWGTLAERAAAMVDQLDNRERRLANALVLLSKGSYDAACDLYDSLRMRNDRDFAAWFGLAQCRMLNRLVYPDPSSPSGWSFRTSAHQAMLAFERAFEILPSVHRGYERGAFGQLRQTLRTTTSVLIGYSAKDSAQFYARAGWQGDTLVFIPYPWQMVAVGDPRTTPPNFAQALRYRREAFKRTASRWSAAFPSSSGAKFAMAVALETLGDVAALDTVRVARSLAPDSSRRRQLAGYEALLLLKFGLPDDTVRLRRAVALGDSLLRNVQSLAGNEAEILTHVAMMLGACGIAAELAQRVMQRSGPQAASAEIWSRSQRLMARAGAGCRVDEEEFSRFATILESGSRSMPAGLRQLQFERWLSRPLLLSATSSARTLRVLASESPDPFAKAMASYSTNRDAATAEALRKVVQPSADTLTLPTPDIALPRARAALMVGDTVAALARLDRTLHAARSFDPQVLTENMCSGPLVWAAVLRADIARARGDRGTARRWATAASILLERSDSELRSDVDRMRAYRDN